MNEADPDEASTVLNTVDAIFSLNVRGTRQYLATSHSNNSERMPVIVACDQDSDLLDAVRNGRIKMLIAQNTFEMGRLAVIELKRLRSSDKTMSQPHTELSPLIVTAENVDSPAVAELLKPYSGFDR
jgi:ABC-type sugar transport system substrate-binding protein